MQLACVSMRRSFMPSTASNYPGCGRSPLKSIDRLPGELFYRDDQMVIDVEPGRGFDVAADLLLDELSRWHLCLAGDEPTRMHAVESIAAYEPSANEKSTAGTGWAQGGHRLPGTHPIPR